jgi:MFS family permease
MSIEEKEKKNKGGKARLDYIFQRRVSAVDHRRPQRWNWSALVQPLDRSLERGAAEPITRQRLRGLRYFWLDGLFTAVSDSFYLGYITLFALAYGASNGQIGIVTASANLLGAISLFPGARLVEQFGRRKSVVVWTAGGVGRAALLLLALLPVLVNRPEVAIFAIILLNGLRSMMTNLGNPAWTAIAADLVPGAMRGRYFGSRNLAIGLAGLAVAPLAGLIIRELNGRQGNDLFGYQFVFLLSFAFGLLATLSYQRIPEPATTPSQLQKYQAGDLGQALRNSPGFLGLVVSAFIWNLSLQIAGPFFNVYLVNNLQASTAMVGLVNGMSSFASLLGQLLFGRLLDSRGAFWLQRFTGLTIPLLPLAWVFVREAWQVNLINFFGGALWAGYNLSNFNLLLEMTPEEQRPRAVALYQTAVFSSAVLGPLLGGYLADAVSFQLIFILSCVGRYIGTFAFLRLAKRPA